MDERKVIEVTSFEGLWDERASESDSPCPHQFVERTTYELKVTPYYGIERTVEACRVCNRRFLKSACGVSHDIGKGRALVREVALSRELPDPGPCAENNYRAPAGSGWWLELPNYVCSLIDEQGIDAAREYVNWTFDQHSSQDAFDKLQARTEAVIGR